MVLEEGRKNGTGIWEIEGHEKIENKINNIVENYIKSEVSIDMNLEEVLVVGSYGSGMGVEGKSDLDIVVLVSGRVDNRSNEYSEAMKEIAGKINYNENSILSGFNEFTGIEAYVYPFLERQKHLTDMCEHEPVETYYNLTEEKKKSYY